MSFVQPFLRGRVLVKRVASVCGMIVVLPLLGCGSQGSFFEDGFSRRNSGLVPHAERPRPSRPVLASSGSSHAYAASGGTKAQSTVAETYATVPTSASLQAGGVQRTSLAPLPEPVKPAADTAVAPAGYTMAAQAYDAPRAGQGDANARPAPVREAANYARKQQQPYPREESDYSEADEARREGYAPEARYGKGEYVKPDPRGVDYGKPQPQGGPGAYVVQPGDTLYGISQRNGISVDELVAVNGLTGHEIYVGQRLRLGGAPQAPKGRGYAEPRPEPRGYGERIPERGAYREPSEERGAPYRAQNEEPRGPALRNAPAALAYEPQRPRNEEAESYQQSRPYQSPYATEERPSREPKRAYREPNGDDGRPEYTSSNSRYTPDGPFEPSPDAPWRGEAEWRRMKQPNGRPQGYEAQPEPRYEGRRAAPPAEAYDARPPYQAQPVERAPYNGRTQREPERESYAAPSRRGEPGGAPSGGYSYTVQRGDTLYEIARRSGVDQRELAEFNGLQPESRLTAGQDLRIPGRGYEGSRPRPEASVQQPAPLRQRPPAQAERTQEAVAQQLAPLRQRSPGQAERGVPVKAVAAVPEQVKPQPQHHAQGQRSSKIITDQLPQRLPAAPAAAEAVEENAPPAKTPHAPEAHAQQRVAAVAPVAADPVAEAAAVEPGPSSSTAAATAHAVAERSAPRECEALLAAPEPRSAKTFRTPVQGMVIAKFGSQNDGSFNDGINFSVPKGTPVKAAENGVVAYAGDELPGFGNLVLIRHADGYVTAYAHNDELLVKKCDVVKRGQIISKAGASGKASSPQLHFELRKDSKPMDPDGQFSGT
jgi:murein DD-endopeptidase MepM/ murein hydrolase activator NlpD